MREKGRPAKMVKECLYVEKTSPQHHLVDFCVIFVLVGSHCSSKGR